MSRADCTEPNALLSFPRVSGDEPATAARGDKIAGFSPRERG